MAHHDQIGLSNPVSGADIGHIRCDWLLYTSIMFSDNVCWFFRVFDAFLLLFHWFSTKSQPNFTCEVARLSSKSTPSVVKSIRQWVSPFWIFGSYSLSQGDIQADYFCFLNKNTTFSTLAEGCGQNPTVTKQKPTLVTKQILWYNDSTAWIIGK